MEKSSSPFEMPFTKNNSGSSGSKNSNNSGSKNNSIGFGSNNGASQAYNQSPMNLSGIAGSGGGNSQNYSYKPNGRCGKCRPTPTICSNRKPLFCPPPCPRQPCCPPIPFCPPPMQCYPGGMPIPNPMSCLPPIPCCPPPMMPCCPPPIPWCPPPMPCCPPPPPCCPPPMPCCPPPIPCCPPPMPCCPPMPIKCCCVGNKRIVCLPRDQRMTCKPYGMSCCDPIEKPASYNNCNFYVVDSSTRQEYPDPCQTEVDPCHPMFNPCVNIGAGDDRPFPRPRCDDTYQDSCVAPRSNNVRPSIRKHSNSSPQALEPPMGVDFSSNTNKHVDKDVQTFSSPNSSGSDPSSQGKDPSNRSKPNISKVNDSSKHFNSQNSGNSSQSPKNDGNFNGSSGKATQATESTNEGDLGGSSERSNKNPPINKNIGVSSGSSNPSAFGTTDGKFGSPSERTNRRPEYTNRVNVDLSGMSYRSPDGTTDGNRRTPSNMSYQRPKNINRVNVDVSSGRSNQHLESATDKTKRHSVSTHHVTNGKIRHRNRKSKDSGRGRKKENRKSHSNSEVSKTKKAKSKRKRRKSRSNPEIHKKKTKRSKNRKRLKDPCEEDIPMTMGTLRTLYQRENFNPYPWTNYYYDCNSYRPPDICEHRNPSAVSSPCGLCYQDYDVCVVDPGRESASPNIPFGSQLTSGSTTYDKDPYSPELSLMWRYQERSGSRNNRLDERYEHFRKPRRGFLMTATPPVTNESPDDNQNKMSQETLQNIFSRRISSSKSLDSLSLTKSVSSKSRFHSHFDGNKNIVLEESNPSHYSHTTRSLLNISHKDFTKSSCQVSHKKSNFFTQLQKKVFEFQDERELSQPITSIYSPNHGWPAETKPGTEIDESTNFHWTKYLQDNQHDTILMPVHFKMDHTYHKPCETLTKQKEVNMKISDSPPSGVAQKFTNRGRTITPTKRSSKKKKKERKCSSSNKLSPKKRLQKHVEDTTEQDTQKGRQKSCGRRVQPCKHPDNENRCSTPRDCEGMKPYITIEDIYPLCPPVSPRCTAMFDWSHSNCNACPIHKLPSTYRDRCVGTTHARITPVNNSINKGVNVFPPVPTVANLRSLGTSYLTELLPTTLELDRGLSPKAESNEDESSLGTPIIEDSLAPPLENSVVETQELTSGPSSNSNIVVREEPKPSKVYEPENENKPRDKPNKPYLMPEKLKESEPELVPQNDPVPNPLTRKVPTVEPTASISRTVKAVPLSPFAVTSEPSNSLVIKPEPSTQLGSEITLTLKPKPLTPFVKPQSSTILLVESELLTSPLVQPEPSTQLVVKLESSTRFVVKPQPSTPLVMKPDPSTPLLIKPEILTPLRIKSESLLTRPVIKTEPSAPHMVTLELSTTFVVESEPSTPFVVQPDPSIAVVMKPDPPIPIVVKPKPSTPFRVRFDSSIPTVETEPSTLFLLKPDPSMISIVVKPEPLNPIVVKPELSTSLVVKPESLTPSVIRPEPSTRFVVKPLPVVKLVPPYPVTMEPPKVSKRTKLPIRTSPTPFPPLKAKAQDCPPRVVPPYNSKRTPPKSEPTQGEPPKSEPTLCEPPKSEPTHLATSCHYQPEPLPPSCPTQINYKPSETLVSSVSTMLASKPVPEPRKHQPYHKNSNIELLPTPSVCGTNMYRPSFHEQSTQCRPHKQRTNDYNNRLNNKSNFTSSIMLSFNHADDTSPRSCQGQLDLGTRSNYYNNFNCPVNRSLNLCAAPHPPISFATRHQLVSNSSKKFLPAIIPRIHDGPVTNQHILPRLPRPRDKPRGIVAENERYGAYERPIYSVDGAKSKDNSLFNNPDSFDVILQPPGFQAGCDHLLLRRMKQKHKRLC